MRGFGAVRRRGVAGVAGVDALVVFCVFWVSQVFVCGSKYGDFAGRELERAPYPQDLRYGLLIGGLEGMAGRQ